ncbi:dienelactone hydrolase family protein [Filimonas effusa]|uniref:Dienelactone hydrolase family protein n=1 Tax=Filimonas effusa TaxID=2508721 RepID=A0A4Q1CZB7_9BACT|nr:dienelactone hydrolase family protein [Filimonas effusa]RXK80747.1 dienelactone hydrolase family protein [Filimonas effusa]
MIRKVPLLLMSMLTAFSSGFSQGGNLSYSDGDTKLTGYYAEPPADVEVASDNRPGGVVVIHAWMGITDHEKSVVDQLGELGYYALAADIYGGVKPANTQEAGQLAGKYKKDYQLYQQRIKAAIEALVDKGANPEKIVVIGYCFGGTGALEAARGGLPVKGVVSFHGGLTKEAARPNTPVNAKVLVLHGADDPYAPDADVQSFEKEMRESKADWQFVAFSNAVHAFTEKKAGNDNSKGAAYNELADKRSWQYLLVFLKELFA